MENEEQKVVDFGNRIEEKQFRDRFFSELSRLYGDEDVKTDM